jgi:hypothetical protein
MIWRVEQPSVNYVFLFQKILIFRAVRAEIFIPFIIIIISMINILYLYLLLSIKYSNTLYRVTSVHWNFERQTINVQG